MAKITKIISNSKNISIDDQMESQDSKNYSLHSDDSLPQNKTSLRQENYSLHSDDSLPQNKTSIRQDPVNKRKLDDLKSYEKIILFKTSFVKQLGSSDLDAKHKSLYKAPAFCGPSQLVQEAELNVMKFLRQLKSEEINLLDEVIDETKKSLICNEIISSLNERFQRHPVAIENKKGHIVVYSSEAEKLEEVNKYLQANFHQDFIPAKDAHTFKYIGTNLKKEIDKLTEANDFMNIFPKNTADGCGFIVMAYGDKKEFDDLKIKLKEIIERVDCEEVKLNISNISVNSEIIIGGIEKKWNVMIHAAGLGKAGSASLNVTFNKEVTLTLVEGKVEDQKVDVLVSSGSVLNCGPVAKSIFAKAGSGLQWECSTKAPLSVGQVVETKAYNLPCKEIFHCHAKKWDGGKTKESQEVLMKVVTTCIQMANNKGLTSIAFPPIACGYLKMPPKISAQCILRSIENYAWSSQHSLKNIIIAIYDPQNLIFKAYKEVLDTKLNVSFNDSASAWEIKKKEFKISVIGSCQNDVLRALRSLQDFSLV